MEDYLDCVQAMYKYRKEKLIIGLTGRTGAGCSTVAEQLKKNFEELDLREPKKYDYSTSDERKYEVIYRFMEKEGTWNKFFVVEGSAVIILFILQKGYELFIDHLEDNCKIDGKENLKKELQELKTIFFVPSVVEPDSKEHREIDFFYYTETLPTCKQKLKKILSKYICHPNKEGEGRAQLYTHLMQTWANNIRASGDPYNSSFDGKHYYKIAEKISEIIELIEKQNKDNGVRICIDAIRNPYEAIYFKDKYRCFYLVSVSTEERFRKGRLTHLSSQELEALDDTEYRKKFDHPIDKFFQQHIQGCVEISDIHLYNPNVSDGKYFFLTEQILKYVALILHPGLVTPTHQERCMQLAYNAKFNSGCLSRQVGAVVTGNDFSVKSVGWNDVPKGQIPCSLRGVESYCRNKDCESYSDYELSDPIFDKSMAALQRELLEKEEQVAGRTFPYCFKDVYNGITGNKNQVYTRSLHAEENAFLQISKYGGMGIKGGYLFTTASPCELCAKKAYQLGITNIYYIDPYPGISMQHILTFGKNNNPAMNLFYGAIGNAYVSLYEPRMAMKDELELLTGINVGKVIEKIDKKESQEEYMFVEVDMAMIFQSRKNVTTEKHIKGKVTGEGIDHIRKEVTWTGSRYIRSYLSEDDYNSEYELIDSGRKISPYEYVINFRRELTRDEEFEYKIITELGDDEEEMRPFYMRTIKNPTQKITMRIIFSEDMIKKVENVRMQVYMDSGREIKRGKAEILEIKNSEVVWQTNNPSLYKIYCIEWDYKLE